MRIVGEGGRGALYSQSGERGAMPNQAGQTGSSLIYLWKRRQKGPHFPLFSASFPQPVQDASPINSQGHAVPCKNGHMGDLKGLLCSFIRPLVGARPQRVSHRLGRVMKFCGGLPREEILSSLASTGGILCGVA